MLLIFISCFIESTEYSVTKSKTSTGTAFVNVHFCIPKTTVNCLSKVNAKFLSINVKAKDKQ